MRVLDLCSGIGGFSLGLQRAGMETVAFCEIDEFCRKILNKHWPDVPVFKDIKALANGSEGLIPECDLICGGVPCQPFSVAGKKEGQQDDRHLWPFMFEIVKQQKPAFVIVENVAGFVNMALDDVLSDLESEGYASQSYLIPACAVDAKHRRDRVWIIAYSDSAAIWHRTERQEVGRHNVQAGRETVTAHDGEAQFVANPDSEWQQQSQGNQQESRGRSIDSSEDVADSNSKRRRSGNTERQNAKDAGQPSRRKGNDTRRVAAWEPEPRVGRVAHGVPNRVDRIKGLGNAVVPQVVEVIGRAIMEFYEAGQIENQG
jgi:DNA (cytosine-5)-methyltransferase 1